MNRKIGVRLVLFITVFLFISLSFTSTMGSASSITHNTIIVDITGNGDYTSIAEALSKADITDIILIKKGLYNEHSLTINKKIEIIGDNSSNTIIDCSGHLAFTITSSYVDISNLQIINTEEYAITTLPDSIGCTISNCIINTNYTGLAIDIRSSYNTISDCNLIGLDNSKQGVKIHGSNNIVSDCYIQDFSNGVLILLNSNDNKVINCNIINNENGIDIRSNSNNNIVTGCNIYSNLQGIKIWQNSNNNHIYLNNFRKNDVDAIDEDINIWDNGIKGNYWDKYRGQDTNQDGIGDTAYKISNSIFDNYPLISIILPDIVSPPANVKITSSSDNTPSFTWIESVYSKGIKGYYVKIDTKNEVFIGDTTSWTSTDILSDGVHSFQIKAEGFDGNESSYTITTFVIDTTIIDTDGDGWSDQEEETYGTDPNNINNYPLDSDGDRLPNSIDTDDDNDGYPDDMEISYQTDTTNPNSYPKDTDKDGIPNDDSPDKKYKGDDDDDNDGLSDIVEIELGSNPENALDVKSIYLSGKLYYLVDASKEGIYDILYEPISKAKTAIEKQDNSYVIDTNGDGNWDYIYRTTDGIITRVSGETQISLILIILVILISIISIISLYYVRIRPIKQKLPKKLERVVKKPLTQKPYKLSNLEKKDTVEMITQTKTLLQHIQEDVKVYMDQLEELEEKFIIPKLEEEIELPKKQPIKKLDIHIIESNVDKILSERNKSDKK